MYVSKCSSCSQQCKGYKNQTSFSRVMITNVLPRFFMNHSVHQFYVTYITGSTDSWGMNCHNLRATCWWKRKKTRAKNVLPNKPHAGHRNHPPAATEWSHLLLCDIICSERIPLCQCREWREYTARFLSLVTLTLDLDIQTRPSEGTNTSSLWIWYKSIQRFPRYLIHKQNKKTKSHRQH